MLAAGLYFAKILALNQRVLGSSPRGGTISSGPLPRKRTDFPEAGIRHLSPNPAADRARLAATVLPGRHSVCAMCALRSFFGRLGTLQKSGRPSVLHPSSFIPNRRESRLRTAKPVIAVNAANGVNAVNAMSDIKSSRPRSGWSIVDDLPVFLHFERQRTHGIPLLLPRSPKPSATLKIVLASSRPNSDR